ncbi:MAG: hypothetical protein Q9176_006557 [Flavoplaca citrina]
MMLFAMRFTFFLPVVVAVIIAWCLDLQSCCSVLGRKRVPYGTVTAITFRSSETTCSAKNQCVSQIQQEANTASCFYKPSVISCSKPTPWLNDNWECVDASEVAPGYSIAAYSVVCEGWEGPDDRIWMLAGSCYVKVRVEKTGLPIQGGFFWYWLKLIACYMGLL